MTGDLHLSLGTVGNDGGDAAISHLGTFGKCIGEHLYPQLITLGPERIHKQPAAACDAAWSTHLWAKGPVISIKDIAAYMEFVPHIAAS